MARKAVPLRLEPELIAEIDAAAKAIDTNRTYFIEDAIKARLHLAKTYVAMDKGPPKTSKVGNPKPGGVTLAEEWVGPIDAATFKPGIVSPGEPLKPRHKTAKPVKLTGGVETRSIRGYDAATGEPIYR